MFKNNSKYFYKVAAMALAAGITAFLPSCFEGLSDNSSRELLKVSLTSILVGGNATEDHIGITTRNTPWTLSGDEDWCRASQHEGEAGQTAVVTVTFLQNPDETSSRKATFVVVSGDLRKEITVEQLPTDIILPNQNPEFPNNKVIHENMINEWYYWNTETQATPGDYNQSYQKFFENYLLHLNENEADGNTWERNTERYLYSYITHTPVAEIGLEPLNYGMEFDLLDYNAGRNSGSLKRSMVGRVLYVMDGSPAQKAGLKRGDWFYRVNDVQLGYWKEASTGWWQYNRLIDSLVRPVEGESPKLGMLTFRPFASALIDEGRSVTVTPERFRGSPILHKSIISTTLREGGQARVGYLVYAGFDPKSENALVEVFENFRQQNITHIVLDLRYSNTGTVEMAEKMANLIVPSSMNGQTFAQYEFNGRHRDLNRTAPLSAHVSSVGLTTVYILTSKHTAGAAELLINAFKGLEGINLVMIGDVTAGMNTGMVVRTYDTEDHRYKARLMAFRCYNALGEWDYHWGLVPNGGDINELEGNYVKWPPAWGKIDTESPDQLLFKAMNYIVNSTSPTSRVIYSGSMRMNPDYPRLFSVRTEMTMEGVPEQ